MHKSKRAKWFFILAGICLFLTFAWSNPYGKGAMQIFFWLYMFLGGLFWMISKLRNAAAKVRDRPVAAIPMGPVQTQLPPPNAWTRLDAVYENGRPIHPPYIKER